MADFNRIRKITRLLESDQPGERAAAAAQLARIAKERGQNISELLSETYAGKQFEFDQQSLDDIAEQVRASYAEAEKWRAEAEMWRAQAHRAPERKAPQAPQAPLKKPFSSVWDNCWRVGFVLVFLFGLADQLRDKPHVGTLSYGPPHADPAITQVSRKARPTP